MTSQFYPKEDAWKRVRSTRDPESSSVGDLSQSVASEESSRRRFLQMTMGAAGLASATGMDVVTPEADSGTDDAQPPCPAAGIDGRQ
jgi:hypothetical protein